MNVTIIVCTYNRAGSLERTLESLAAMAVPRSIEWEVLVIDNNSSDGTRAACERCCLRWPGKFRYIFEQHQGLSHARNTGIREARGELVAFTDDDITVDVAWLQQLIASLTDGQVVGAGGRILPDRPFVPPAWLAAEALELGGVLPFFDLGEKPSLLTRPPYGANMAYRKDAFQKYGLFRTDLGRLGDSLISSEDAEFGLRLLRAGEFLQYEPKAIVFHAISEDRLRKTYFLAWWFGLGRSSVRLAGPRRNIWGIPRPLLSIARATFRLVRKALGWVLSLRADQRFFFKLQVWMLAGCILESYRQLVRGDVKTYNSQTAGAAS